METLKHPGVGRQEFTQNPAALPGAVWRGAFESYRRALRRSTEACDALHFGVFFTVVGLIAGRAAYLDHGRRLFPNVFATLIGRTGGSRKSTAIYFGKRLRSELDPDSLTLSTASWEGLVDALAGDDVLPVRLLMMPGEFRSLAAKAKQQNSGLIPGLTDLYDTPTELRHKTRGSDAVAIRPFLSILTASTQEWFRESFDADAVAGGFLNRWVFFDGEPKPPNPFPELPEPEAWASTVETVAAMQSRLRLNPPDRPTRLKLSTEARELWAAFYRESAAQVHRSELLAQMAERLQDGALKLALVYALLEGTEEIRSDQLAAALEFARWQRLCHGRVFEGFGEDRFKRLEDRMVKCVKDERAKGHKLTKRALQRKLGGSAVEFHRVFDALARVNVFEFDTETKCVTMAD